MKTNPPPDRRKFVDARDQMEYLYHKLLYEREDRVRARIFAQRLAKILSKTSIENEEIFPEECWSLIFEAKEDLPRAIEHREMEIRLIRRLHEISRGTRQQEHIFGLYGYDDLGDRLDLLVVLYRDSGNLHKAMRTLRESKRLCEKHGLKFDGEDIQQECIVENEDSEVQKNGTGTRR